MNPMPPITRHRPVLIVGGGPVGLTLAALLTRFGIASCVLEADDGYCSGSRAICISRRSMEVLAWAGIADAVLAKGLAWAGGRSYFRDTEVLHFQMPSEPTQRFAPMLNIQQYYIERFAHEALQRFGNLAEVRWSTRVTTVRPQSHGVEVEVETGGRVDTLQADWLVACDGGRSLVREQLGLSLQGMQYEGRYVIVDIEQKTQRPVERLAWFDPPSNPGSTILMHRQPDHVWRIDYQLRDGEDPDEAVRPENVLPRVQRHLDMIGETAPWKPLWISIYNAKCLTLQRYRHARVMFAGDAAHLVPIFGVRGLNSGLDDVGNLAWKLARVIAGQVDDRLLDSYSQERVAAAHENIAFGAKSTEFMAPPNFAFSLMREATLRLAVSQPSVRSLINPRQTTPVGYRGSPLNIGDENGIDWGPAPRPGDIAPEALLSQAGSARHLTQEFGNDFVLLRFTSKATQAEGIAMDEGLHVRVIHPAGVTSHDAMSDQHGQAWSRYCAEEGSAVLVRPDGYVMGRWRQPDSKAIRDAIARAIGSRNAMEHA